MCLAGPTSPSPAAATLYAQPSDVALVNDVLRPWVTSGNTKAGGAYVHTADLYSANPEELARRFAPAVSLDGERTWYFLSPLRSKSPRDRRKVRAVADGTGCWHSEAGPKNVVDHIDGGRHVGYRQSFSFMRRGDAGDADVRAGWIMAEFHLHHHGTGRKVEGLVLCKMYRSPRNRGPAAASAPDGDDDDVGSGVSLSADTAFSCHRNKAVDDENSNADEDSNAVTPRWQRHTKNPDGAAAMATAMTAAAGDDEASNAVAPRWQRHTKNPDGAAATTIAMTAVAATATAMTAAAGDGEVSNAVAPRWQQHTNNPDGAAATATAMTAAARDDEVSGAIKAVAPWPKNKAVAADDEDLLASSPARKKMRLAVADTENSGAALALKAMAVGGTPAAAAELHCPQCGFHLAALQALVTLTKSMPVVPREIQEIQRP